MSRPRCRSTSAHASPHSRVKERIFEAVRMGPRSNARHRACERGNERASHQTSLLSRLIDVFRGFGRILRRRPSHYRQIQTRSPSRFLSHPRRRRSVQERGPAGFAQGTPPHVDRRSDAVSAPIARIAPGNSIPPEQTPSSSHAEQSRTFFALARGRLARRGGIAIHAKMLHLPRGQKRQKC